MVSIDTLKQLEKIKDIDTLTVSDLEKAEIFFTSLYVYYRKIGLGLQHAKSTVAMVQKLSDSEKNDNVPYIKGNEDLKKYIGKWTLQGEQLFLSLKKGKKLNEIKLLQDFKY